MNYIWNKRDLKPPLMGSYTTRMTQFQYSEEITESLELAQNYYKKQSKFHEAMLINQQVLYIRQTQFRSDIGFQKLQKVKTAYKRLTSMNISTLLGKILNSISIEKFNNSIQLPTKETFEYLLIKLMGLYKLIVRIVELTKEAAECFLKLANLSFFVELSTMLLAVLSDIYCIGGDIARKTIYHYNNLIKYHSALKSNKRKWSLPKNFQFPRNLVECTSSIELNLIKYNDLKISKLNKIHKGVPTLQVNKLIQQSDMEIGCQVSRSEVDKSTKIKKKSC